MTPNRPKSAKKSGSRKSSAGAMHTRRPQDPRSSFSLLSKHKIWTAASLAAVIVVAIGLGYQLLNGSTRNTASASAATFVGSESCVGCHQAQAQLWRASQHQRAMQHATDKAVLGDFNDASFDHYGVRSRFFRKDGKFLVETDGADGKLATFEVKYIFGVDPLQQYLVEFPDGRLQALSLAWNSRPKESGGQRWFHLYPNEKIEHDDVLHWTRLNQNWNFMCAGCHSTGVRKNYDAASDHFATSFAEISVGCEACHGQGSGHVAWAKAQQSWWPFGRPDDPRKGLLVRFDERRDVAWPIDPKTGNARRNFTPALFRKEVETCGLCHARRGEFSEDWVPGRWLSDTHVVSPLARGLYEADGQMRDEVYNYGSFKQSRMFAAGVTGGDCRSRNFTPALFRKEVETCGLCHARRGEFSEDWVPGRWLSDTHVVSPLARGLYEADGQMRDEVYNYGSFKQSRMFAAGVTCGDCHEPHGAKLRASGDGVCLQCHASDKYAAVAHHHHADAKEPLACASCHMPSRTYMVVDRRHDHSFRVPRPDFSVKLGTPNACNDCHTDQSAEWAAAAIERWHGPTRKGFQTYAQAFHAAWTETADAAALLAAVVSNGDTPAIARASALSELGSRLSPAAVNLARTALADPDPMVRIGALDMLEHVPAAQVWPLVVPLLFDSSRGVRIRAAAVLAAFPAASQRPADREPFERAAAEFIAAQRLNADRPEARSALATFLARRGRAAEAETEYKAALRLSPQFAPAAINLADLYRQLGRDDEGEGLLRAAIEASTRDAGLHHALGLTLTRLKRPDAALDELRRARSEEHTSEL